MTRRLFRWDKETRTMIEIDLQPAESVAPAIFGDEIKPTVCQVDGRTYTSRSELNKTLQASGYRPKEAGAKYDKKTRFGNESELSETVQRARTMVRDGMAPLTEWDKHVCKLENQALSRKR